MCTIDRILIKGIRSFSPSNQQVIAFYKPLTLIVGANGAGKTTVIECLKQACTGELPPNTRSGQSFVHDPKVAHETEVKAQIMLRFHTGAGQQITVVRAFQLSQKKTALQFKTLDSTLKTKHKDTGAETAVPYRCSDIDKMVPGLMGVSKAVLDNVIFVHQEESNWPLAEGKALKERFDDIFAATKYTKALETLRKLRTEKTQEVREAKLTLDHLRTHRDAAQRLQDDQERAEGEVARCDSQACMLEAQIAELEQQVSAINSQLTRLAQLAGEAHVVEARMDELAKQAASKRAQMERVDFVESTAELSASLENFDIKIEDTQRNLSATKRTLVSLRVELQSQHDVFTKEVKRQSVLQADKNAHDARVRERDAFVAGAARELAVSLPVARAASSGSAADAPLSDAAIARFEEALRHHVADMQQTLLDAKTTHRAKDEQLSAAVDGVMARITAHVEQMKAKRDMLRMHRSNMDALSAQAEAVMVNEVTAADAQRTVDSLQDTLRGKNEEQAKANFESKLAREKRDIDELTARIVALRQERDRLASASENTTRLRLKATELAEKRELLASTLRARRTKLLNLLGPGGDLPPPEALKEACDAALARKRDEQAAQQAQLGARQARESAVRVELNRARDGLLDAQRRRDAALADLRAALVPNTPELAVVWEPGHALENERVLEAALAHRKAVAESAHTKLTSMEAMHKYGLKVRSLMAADRCCPACYRDFSTEAELQASLAQCEQEFQDHPARLARQRDAAAAAATAAGMLERLRSVWKAVTDIETKELRGLTEQVRPLEDALSEAIAAVRDAEDLVATAAAEADEAGTLVADVVWPLDRQAKEVASLAEQVARMEVAAVALGSAGGGAARTVSDIDAELEMADLDLARRSNEREFTLRKQNRLKEEILGATTALSDAREALVAARRSIDKKREILDKVAELEAACAALGPELAAQERRTPELTREREAAVAARTQERSRMQAEEARLEAKLREAVQLQDAYMAKAAPIKDHEARGAPAQLAAAQAAVDGAQRRLEALKQDIADKDAQVLQAQSDLTQQETKRRQLQDVLALRQMQEQLQEQEAALARLQDAARRVGQESGLKARAAELGGRLGSLQQALAKNKGVRDTHAAAAARALQALQAPQYKDVVPRYNRQFALVMYTELANSDLDKYHKALEKALLSFHTSKMADINRLIKELWQKTYRGQDIDYIQVKADADTTRSYNYRVVMYSGGAELDMRGRCSAGQKVLACLIIRLALAEVFCLHCGILALDEPTTNLDSDNALALADALRAIMVARREQQNFQLIVITHDERFAHHLGTREHAEYLWRITKDDAQHTHVVRELIDD